MDSLKKPTSFPSFVTLTLHLSCSLLLVVLATSPANEGLYRFPQCFLSLRALVAIAFFICSWCYSFRNALYNSFRILSMVHVFWKIWNTNSTLFCFVLFPLYFLIFIFIFTIIMYVIVVVIEVDYFQTIQEGFVITHSFLVSAQLRNRISDHFVWISCVGVFCSPVQTVINHWYM